MTMRLDSDRLDSSSSPHENSPTLEEITILQTRWRRCREISCPDLSLSDVSEPSSHSKGDHSPAEMMQTTKKVVTPDSTEFSERKTNPTLRYSEHVATSPRLGESWQSPRMRASDFAKATPKMTNRRTQFRKTCSVPSFASDETRKTKPSLGDRSELRQFLGRLETEMSQDIGRPEDSTMHSHLLDHCDNSTLGDDTIEESFRPAPHKRTQLPSAVLSPPSSLDDFLDVLIFDAKKTTLEVPTKPQRRRLRGGSMGTSSTVFTKSNAISVTSRDGSDLKSYLESKNTKVSRHTSGAVTLPGDRVSASFSDSQSVKADPPSSCGSVSSSERGKDPPGDKLNRESLGGFMTKGQKKKRTTAANTVAGDQVVPRDRVASDLHKDKDKKKDEDGSNEAKIIDALMKTALPTPAKATHVEAAISPTSDTFHTRDDTVVTQDTDILESARSTTRASVPEDSPAQLSGFFDRKGPQPSRQSGVLTVAGDRVAIRFAYSGKSTKEVLEILEREQSPGNYQDREFGSSSGSRSRWMHKMNSMSNLYGQSAAERMNISAPVLNFDGDKDDEIDDSARIVTRSGGSQNIPDLQLFLDGRKPRSHGRKSGAITIPGERVDVPSLGADSLPKPVSKSPRLADTSLNTASRGATGVELPPRPTNRRTQMKKMLSVPALGTHDKSFAAPVRSPDLRLGGFLKKQSSTKSMKLSKVSSLGDVDMELSGYLDRHSGNDAEVAAGYASVAGDQLTLKKQSSLTGELYVRADGKRTRAIRKPVDGEILTRPDGSKVRIRRKSRAVSDAASQGSASTNDEPKDPKSWLDQYLEGEVSQHDSAMPSTAADNEYIPSILGSVEVSPSGEKLEKKRSQRDLIKKGNESVSSLGSASRSRRTKSPASSSRRDAFRRLKSVPSKQGPSAPPVGLCDKRGNPAKGVCRGGAEEKIGARRTSNAGNPRSMFQKTKSVPALPNLSPSRSPAVGDSRSRQRSSRNVMGRTETGSGSTSQAQHREKGLSKGTNLAEQRAEEPANDTKKAKLRGNPDILRKALSCQNLGGRADDVADRLILVERLQCLTNDPLVATLRPKPKVVSDDQDPVSTPPTPQALKLEAESTVTEATTQDDDFEVVLPASSPPNIPVRKVSSHSEAASEALTNRKVTSPNPNLSPTRSSTTRWQSVPRNLGHLLNSPVSPKGASPWGVDATGANEEVSIPVLDRPTPATLGKGDDKKSDEPIHSIPPSIPVRKASRHPDMLLNAVPRDVKKPSIHRPGQLQASTNRWSSVPRNLGSAKHTGSQLHDTLNLDSPGKKRRSTLALGAQEIAAGSILELDDGNHTVCSELTDAWSADVLKTWLETQARNNGTIGSHELLTLLKEQGLLKEEPASFHNSWEGLSLSEFGPGNVSAEQMVRQSSSRWEGSPGPANLGATIPRPERLSENDGSEKPGKEREALSERFGWMKKTPFRFTRPKAPEKK